MGSNKIASLEPDHQKTGRDTRRQGTSGATGSDSTTSFCCRKAEAEQMGLSGSVACLHRFGQVTDTRLTLDHTILFF